MWVSQLYVCVRYTWIYMQWCVGVVTRQSLGKRAVPCSFTCVSCSWGKQTRQLHSVCRQTDRPGHSCVCLHVWIQYLQHNWYVRVFISVCICERGLRNGDGQRQLWAELGTCTWARVWKMFVPLLQIYLMWLTSIKPGTFRATHCSSLTVHRTENHTSSCRKALSPTPPRSLAHCMC